MDTAFYSSPILGHMYGETVFKTAQKCLKSVKNVNDFLPCVIKYRIAPVKKDETIES